MNVFVDDAVEHKMRRVWLRTWRMAYSQVFVI